MACFALAFVDKAGGGEGACASRDAEARQRERLVRALLAATPDCIWLKDGQGRWVLVSDSALEYYGLRGYPYEGKTDLELASVTRDHRDALLRCAATDEEAWAKRGELHLLEELRTPDGRVTQWELIKAPLFNEDGTRAGMVVIGRDVTRHVECEKELQRLYAAERSARTVAEDATSARDEFITVAAHEFRTPATALHVAIESLRRELDEAQIRRDHLIAAVERIERQCTRLDRQVEELVDATGLSVEPMPKRRVVELGALVQDVLSTMASELARAGCEVQLSVRERVPGRCDAPRLREAIERVVANSMKFGARKPIEIRVERQDDSARLVIRDHGIGVAPEAQRRIFGRFERAVSSRHYGGLGLGLYLVERVVSAHSGRVEVESTPGGGATFVVELPTFMTAVEESRA